MKFWESEYNGHMIRIENFWDKERLYVDGEVQDEQHGYTSQRIKLTGKLPSGEEIKVNIGRTFKMTCQVFVDHKKVPLTNNGSYMIKF